MPLRNPFSSWSRSSVGQPGSWRDADGSINWSRVATMGAATALGGPIIGRLATGIYDRVGGGGSTAPSNYQLPMPQGPNMGGFNSPPQPGSTTTNQQLAQTMEQWIAQQNQNRIEAARTRDQGAGGPSGPMPSGAGTVTAANPNGAYRTRDETGAQRDSRYATEAAFVNMRDNTNEAINANQLAAAMRGRRQ